MARPEQDVLHGDSELVERGRRQQPLLVGTFGLGKQVDLHRPRQLEVAELSGGGFPAGNGVFGRAGQNRVRMGGANLLGETHGGVAAVVGAEHLADTTLDVAEEAHRRLARGAQRCGQFPARHSQPVEDDQDVERPQTDAELLGRGGLEMVRLVDDQDIVFAQGLAAGGGVGKQQRVVGDHDRGGLGSPSCGHHEALVALPVGACRAQAVASVGLHVAPERLLLAVEVELAAVALLGFGEPGQELQLETDAVEVGPVRPRVGLPPETAASGAG